MGNTAKCVARRPDAHNRVVRNPQVTPRVLFRSTLKTCGQRPGCVWDVHLLALMSRVQSVHYKSRIGRGGWPPRVWSGEIVAGKLTAQRGDGPLIRGVEKPVLHAGVVHRDKRIGAVHLLPVMVKGSVHRTPQPFSLVLGQN